MLTFRICDWQKCSLIECEMIVKLVKKFKHSNKLHNAISDHSVCRLYPAGEADCRLSLVKPSNFIHLIDDCSPMWNFLDQQEQNDASDQNSILNRSCQSNDSEWPENSFINSTNKSSKSKSHGIKNPLERVEIIVILEGIVEATGMPCMLRTSYSQEEILWGYDFEPLYQVNKNDGSLMIDFDKFNQAGLGVFHFSEIFLEQICYYFFSYILSYELSFLFSKLTRTDDIEIINSIRNNTMVNQTFDLDYLSYSEMENSTFITK